MPASQPAQRANRLTNTKIFIGMVVNVKCGWISWVWVNLYEIGNASETKRVRRQPENCYFVSLFIRLCVCICECVTNDQTPSTSLTRFTYFVWTWSVLCSVVVHDRYFQCSSHTKCRSLPCIFHYVLFSAVILMTLVLTLLLIMIVVVTGTKISACRRVCVCVYIFYSNVHTFQHRIQM